MHKTTFSNLTNQLKIHEGFSSVIYVCPAGVPTIGYGHALTNKLMINEFANKKITPIEGEAILISDIKEKEKSLNQFYWYRKLNEARKAVIVNMAFNMGVKKLLTFKGMIGAIKKNDFSTAAQEMILSLWFSQVGTRSDTLVNQMMMGVFVDKSK